MSSFVLTYRGDPIARLSPYNMVAPDIDDPIYRLVDISLAQGDLLSNEEMDAVVYGQSHGVPEHPVDSVFGTLGLGGRTDKFLRGHWNLFHEKGVGLLLLSHQLIAHLI